MITVYSTPTCVFCHALKEYLKSKGVDFTEKDLTTDEDAAKWVFENTGQLAVPVTDFDGQLVVGFDRHSIETILREKKLVK